MNETPDIKINRRELINIIRAELRPLKETFETKDLVNRQQAIEILGISARSFATYITTGIVKTITTNAAGGKFFSRRELYGLKADGNKKEKKTWQKKPQTPEN